MLSNSYSFWVCIVLVVVVGAAVSFVYEVGIVTALLSVAVGLFVYGSIEFGYTKYSRYDLKFRLRRKIADLHAVFVIILSIIGVFIVGFLFCAYKVEAFFLPQAIVNLRVFGWSAFIGFAIALLHWFFWARTEYSRRSEYQFRQWLEANHYPMEDAERWIKEFRVAGLLQGPR